MVRNVHITKMEHKRFSVELIQCMRKRLSLQIINSSVLDMKRWPSKR